jgi:hypothetical protein
MAISILFNPMPQRIFEADGDFASGAKAFFYLARTTTPLSVYTDAPLTSPHTWPVVADAYGLLAPIYIGKGTDYKVRIEDEAGNILYAADGIDNPAEPTGGDGGGGGGGGLVIKPDQIYKTGDFDWQPTSVDRDGWVRSNGQLIGPPTASVADLKSTLYENLFIFLWNTFPNTLCPVTPGGRGTNAALDWGGGLGTKAIGTLDMRGYGIAGLDNMGTSAANRVQVTSSLGTTIATTNAAVGSTVGLCVGMFIESTGIASGTKVAAITGLTTITLSLAATSTVAGVPARFSIFQDAEKAGYAGGENTHVQIVSELAPHAHTFAGAPGVAFVGTIKNLAFGTDVSVTGNTTLNNTGSAAPMNLWTPTRLGTWFVKV